MTTFSEAPEPAKLPDDVVRFLISVSRDGDDQDRTQASHLLSRYLPVEETHRREIADLKAKIRNVQDKLRAAQAENTKHERRLKEAESAIAHSRRMGAQVNRMRTEYLALEAQNDALKAKIAELELGND